MEPRISLPFPPSFSSTFLPPLTPPIPVILLCIIFLPRAQKTFIDAIEKHCLYDLLPRTLSAYFYFQNCSFNIKMSRYADFAAKYGSYDVRASDDAHTQERDENIRHDLPRPFIPRPVPKGQVERRYAGPVDPPATIAFRHRVVEQAVANYKAHRPDSARICAEAGANYRRRWEAARAAEMEPAGAAGGEDAGSAQPETPGDAPEAEAGDARHPSTYVCDCAECELWLEAPPPSPRRRAARGAASGIRRADAAARPRQNWSEYR